MADNSIMFKIGSVFQGEGFKKAQQAVGSMNGKVKQATGTAGQLAHALGGLDSSASKAVGAVSGLVQSFLTMGVAGAAIQGVMLGVNFLISKMNEENKKTKESIDKVTKVLDDMGKQSPKYLEELNDELKSIEGNFDAITAKANAFGAALEGVRAANANGGLVDLEIEKLNAILGAHSEAEVKTIETTYALKAAIEKSANIEAEWSVKRANAAEAVEEAESKIANIDEQLAAVEAKRATAEEKMQRYREQGDQRWVEVQKELVGIIKKSGELERKRITAEMDLETAKKLEEKTAIEAANASKSAKTAILQAEIAEKNLAEANAKRKREEEAAAEAAREKARADRDAAQLQHEREVAMKEAKTIQERVNESSKNLAKAQDELWKAIDEYKKNWADNKLYEAASQGVIGLGDRPGLAKTMSEEAINKAINDGKIRTVRELDRFTRETERANRDRISEEVGQLNRERQRFERLTNPDGTRRKGLSKADQKFLDDYETIQERARRDAEKIKQKEADVVAAQEASRQASQDLKTLADNSKSIPEIVESLEKVKDKLDAALRL